NVLHQGDAAFLQVVSAKTSFVVVGFDVVDSLLALVAAVYYHALGFVRSEYVFAEGFGHGSAYGGYILSRWRIGVAGLGFDLAELAANHRLEKLGRNSYPLAIVLVGAIEHEGEDLHDIVEPEENVREPAALSVDAFEFGAQIKFFAYR